MATETPRILMFAPAFAPHFFSEGLVNSKLALAMIARGWEVTVLTAPGGGYAYASGWQEPWAPLRAVRVEISSAGGPGLKGKLDKALALARHRQVLPGAYWAALAAREALRRHAERPFTAIVSRSTSCIAHLPAIYVKRATGLPWIANWNDPPGFLRLDEHRIDAPPAQRWLHRRYMRAAARAADWNTFPSQRLRDYLGPFLDLAADDPRARVIPHLGIDLAAMEAWPKADPSPDVFVVRHAGNLAAGHEQRALLEGWRRFTTAHPGVRARLEFVGKSLGGLPETGDPTIAFLGPMPFMACLEQLNAADALLLIDPGRNAMVMLSKIPDYAMIAKPFIGVGPQASTTRDLMAAHRPGLHVDNGSPEQIAEAFATVYRLKAAGQTGGFGFETLRDYTSPEAVLASHLEMIAAVGARS